MEKKFRNITLISILFSVILMLPILYLTFVNRASGDDYGYGIRTRYAWMSSHSLIEVGKAMCETIRVYYGGWQGTWFSIALFSLQPEVFHDSAYVIVAVLMLFVWIGSTFYLFRHILHKSMGFGRWSCLFITVCFLVISIEFIPSSRSAIFWFNGCAHYMIPFAMCQVLTVWLFRYCTEYRKSTLAGIFLFMTLLGGSNYQAALFALITAFYTGISAWILRRNKRIFALCIPISLELVGLWISFMSPGNKSRAGEDFGFSVSRAVKTVGKSFVCGIKDIETYVSERPLVFAGLLFLFIVFIIAFCAQEEAYDFKHPIFLSLMLFCLYSAMQAPAIYADVEVSGGVPNTNYLVFLLAASGILLVIAQRVSKFIRSIRQEKTETDILRMIVISGMILCALFVFIGRSNIRQSTSYVSLVYITSGQAQDYREQMDLQTRLMEDESTQDVVVPGINDVQGPLMHMPVSVNRSAWTNTVTAGFYGKRSVVAMERPEWIEKYGD